MTTNNTVVRRTTTVVVEEMVRVAPVTVPGPVVRVQPAPVAKLPAPSDGPAIGHIVRVRDSWVKRPGGKLPVAGQFKVTAYATGSGKWLCVGLIGSVSEGREGWMYPSEMTKLADSIDGMS